MRAPKEVARASLAGFAFTGLTASAAAPGFGFTVAVSIRLPVAGADAFVEVRRPAGISNGSGSFCPRGLYWNGSRLRRLIAGIDLTNFEGDRLGVVGIKGREDLVVDSRHEHAVPVRFGSALYGRQHLVRTVLDLAACRAHRARPKAEVMGLAGRGDMLEIIRP